MSFRIRLYSNKDGEIYKFLDKFYNDQNLDNQDNVFNDIYLHSLEWENIYSNPIEIATIIGVFIDNVDDFKINMWLNLDKDFFINITKNNADDVIKYLYERFPY